MIHKTRLPSYSGSYKTMSQEQQQRDGNNNFSMIMNVTIEYVMIEENIGSIIDGNDNNRSYRKYVAIWIPKTTTTTANSTSSDPPRIPTEVETLDDTSTTTYVTVAQWMYMVAAVQYDNNNNNNNNNNNDNDNNNNNNDDTGMTAITLLNGIICTLPYDAIFFETPPISSYHQYISQHFEFVVLDAPELYKMTAIDNVNYHDLESFEVPLSPPSSSKNNPYVASFTNLGGDAVLIVPQYIHSNDDNNSVVSSITTTTTTEGSSSSSSSNHNWAVLPPFTARYAHIANFIRYHHQHSHQSKLLVYAVWQMVAQTYHEQIRSKFLVLDNNNDNKFDEKAEGLWLSTSGMGVLYLHFRIDTKPKYYTYIPYTRIPTLYH